MLLNKNRDPVRKSVWMKLSWLKSDDLGIFLRCIFTDLVWCSKRKPQCVMCHLLKTLKKAKEKIKAPCGKLPIFKERNSFDWCYDCLLHSMVSKTWWVPRSFKGYCNSPAYVACVCVCVWRSNSLSTVCFCEHPPPAFAPSWDFTCNSCWWICCSWKRRLAHQTPIPERSRSESLPQSRPGSERISIFVWSGKQKAQERKKSHY